MEKLPAASRQLPVNATEDSKPQAIAGIPFALSFFSYSCTSVQMHIAEGTTQIQSKQVSFDGDKFNVEQFEGQLPAAVFEQTMLDTQRLFIDYIAGMFKQMSSWFPFSPLGHCDDKK